MIAPFSPLGTSQFIRDSSLGNRLSPSSQSNLSELQTSEYEYKLRPFWRYLQYFFKFLFVALVILSVLASWKMDIGKFHKRDADILLKVYASIIGTAGITFIAFLMPFIQFFNFLIMNGLHTVKQTKIFTSGGR